MGYRGRCAVVGTRRPLAPPPLPSQMEQVLLGLSMGLKEEDYQDW